MWTYVAFFLFIKLLASVTWQFGIKAIGHSIRNVLSIEKNWKIFRCEKIIEQKTINWRKYRKLFFYHIKIEINFLHISRSSYICICKCHFSHHSVIASLKLSSVMAWETLYDTLKTSLRYLFFSSLHRVRLNASFGRHQRKFMNNCFGLFRLFFLQNHRFNWNEEDEMRRKNIKKNKFK